MTHDHFHCQSEFSLFFLYTLYPVHILMVLSPTEWTVFFLSNLLNSLKKYLLSISWYMWREKNL